MKILLVGEAFRRGGQGSRTRDLPESHEGQRLACLSHVEFAKFLESRGTEVEFLIESYATKYKKDLLSWYGKRLKEMTLHEKLMGLEELIRNGIPKTKEGEPLFVCRIDLLLKPFLRKVFDPTWNRLYFPSACWVRECMIGRFPRVSDMMMFVPSNILPKIIKSPLMRHGAWADYINRRILDVQELGLMLNTYHDSDSAKDYNPLYTIVNRNTSNYWYSVGYEMGKNGLPTPTEERRVFPDWPPSEIMPKGTLEDTWEWWHQERGGLHRFINFIRFSKHDIFGQTIGHYDHPDQRFWHMEDECIVIMNDRKHISSRLFRETDGSYRGVFELNKSINFMIRRADPNKWLKKLNSTKEFKQHI